MGVERFSGFDSFGAAEDPRVVEQGGADDEGVREVQAGHGGELVDIVAADPDGFGVLLADGVVEAVCLG